MTIQQFYNKEQVVIDIAHQRVHEGRYFSGGYYNASVANNGVIELVIQTSSTYYTHTKVTIAAGGNATLKLFEDATFSGAGTSVTMSNHNRASSKAFSGTVTHTPTLSTDGTQINSPQLVPGGTSSGGGGGGRSSVGGDYSYSNEFILDISTTYLVRGTNISGGAVPMSIVFECYQPNL